MLTLINDTVIFLIYYILLRLSRILCVVCSYYIYIYVSYCSFSLIYSILYIVAYIFALLSYRFSRIPSISEQVSEQTVGCLGE